MAQRDLILETAKRNVSEQEARVSQQEALVAHLRREGLATDEAEDKLTRMYDILDKLRDVVARLERKPDSGG